MSVGGIPHLSKVCLPYNLKITSDDRIKNTRREKHVACMRQLRNFTTFLSEIMPGRHDLGDPSQR
jgi:hypothetical protein